MTETISAVVESDEPAGYGEYLEFTKTFTDEKSFHPQVLDQEHYAEVLTKPSLVKINEQPYLLGVEDADSLVHSERCKKLTEGVAETSNTEIYVSLVPIKKLLEDSMQLSEALEIGKKQILVFAEFDITDGSTEENFSERLHSAGISIKHLEHPNLRSQASLNLFELNLHNATDREQPTSSIRQVVQGGSVPKVVKKSDGKVFIASGDELEESVVAQLWDVFSSRFDEISDNLPVRLEENEESTRDLWDNPDATFIYKVDENGQIVACVFVGDNLETYPWINPEFIAQREKSLAIDTAEAPYSVFVPGIASKKGSGGSTAAKDCLEAFTGVLHATNQPSISVRFECTDVSSKYVPLISMRAARNQPAFSSCGVEMVGQKKFVLLDLSSKG